MSALTARLTAAKEYHRAGRLEEAESLYREILRRDGDRAEAWYLLGVARHKRGDARQAEDCLRQALRVRPAFAAARNHLGIVLGQRHRHAEAADHLREAIRLEPGLADAHYNLGLVLLQSRRSGDLDEAVRCFRQALQWRPVYPHALRNLRQALKRTKAVGETMALDPPAANAPPVSPESLDERGRALLVRGRREEAAAHFRQAIRLRPDAVESYNNLGLTLLGRQESAEAEAAFRQALGLSSAHAPTHNNLGLALHRQGRRCEALDHWREAVRLEPHYPQAHNNLGLALLEGEDWSGAETSLREAVRLRPDFAEAHNNLGVVLSRQGSPAKRREALARWREAVRLRPDYVEPRNNLRDVLRDPTWLTDAEGVVRAAIQRQPDDAAAHNNLGLALLERDDLAGAESSLREAIRLRSDLADAHGNLGIVLWRQGRLADAQTRLGEALRLRPDFAEAHNNLGNVFFSQGDLSEALACYERSSRLKPAYADAHANRALALLARGAWEEGWTEYEWRWKLRSVRPRSFRQPMWDGTPLAGRTILLHAEQGLGDTLHFIRYAALAKALGGTVVVVCQKPLTPLLASCPGIDRLLAFGEPLPPFDVHAPLLTLPRLLRTTPANVPAAIPYLHADEQRLGQWRSRLVAFAGFKVGIAWQGDRRHRADPQRSTPLACFAPLAQVPGVHLFSLQKGSGSEQLAACPFAVTDLGERLDNSGGAFLDTAAVMKNLDLIVCVDTALGHLAGGLGVPVWLALPFAPDWRWLLEREDTPWYPTMRLFRQRQPGDWPSVFEDMATQLRRRMSPVAGGGLAGMAETSSPLDAATDEAATWRRQGLELFQRGRFKQAEERLRRAVGSRPSDPDLHNNLGVVLARRGRAAEALACFEEAMRLLPDYAHAQRNRGNALRDLGRHAEAVPCYQEVLRLRPQDADACHDLGRTLLLLHRPQEAIPSLRQAARLRPDHADTHDRLGQALAEDGRTAEAADSYRRLIALRPERAEPHHNLGVVLTRLSRHDEAAAAYRQAALLRPDRPETHNVLGLALVEADKPTEAVAAFRAAIRLQPDYAEAHNNLAITLAAQGDPQAALTAFDEALRLRPDYPKARTNRALALLQTGDYERGWREYEWRWRTEDFKPRTIARPRWDGKELAGRTILLYAEQGLGDTLQFVRYAPLVKRRGGRVLLEAPARLLPLLASCPGIDRLLARGVALPEFDVEAPLLSLPGIFGTTSETIPAPVPYLSADPVLRTQWAAALPAGPAFKIGIAWQGSPSYRGDRQRSLAPRHFEPLARLPGVRLLSLQKGPGAERLATVPADWDVVDLGPRLDEGVGAFVDTAAVVSQLDLVVSCDTSVGHLAGALAVPVWLALPFACDWRWGRAGENTPWYPTMRLFRQRRPGDWDDVFARIVEAIRERLAGAAARQPPRVEISPGELLDKITILEIKQARLRDDAKLAHVRVELAALVAARARAADEPAEVAAAMAELQGVNERLWDVEDELRRCERCGDFSARFIELARSVYQLNDRRTALKRRINERCGSTLIEEKSYAATDNAATPAGSPAPGRRNV